MRCKGFGLVQRKTLKSARNPSALSCLLSRLLTCLRFIVPGVPGMEHVENVPDKKPEEGRLTYALTLSKKCFPIRVSQLQNSLGKPMTLLLFLLFTSMIKAPRGLPSM